jgi:hypothetical protein
MDVPGLAKSSEGKLPENFEGGSRLESFAE